MKKKLFAGMFAAALALSILTGCGGSNASADTAYYAGGTVDMKSESTAAADNGWYADEAYEYPEEAEAEWAPEAQYDAGTGGSRVYQNENAKLIRRAYISVQTTEFDEAVRKLTGMVTAADGYFESAEVQSGSYYDNNARRYGYYTIRIPAAKYSEFVQAQGNLGHVASCNESSEDIGEQYYDTEMRLSTLRTKQERLLALLEKAEQIEDIITIESALTEVQYQIESYSSTLNRYDSLVGYSTITLELSEVIRVEDEPGEKASLGSQLSSALGNGLANFGEGLRDFIVWVAYNLMGILLFAAVVVVIILLIRRRRRVKRAKKEKKEKLLQEQPENMEE